MNIERSVIIRAKRDFCNLSRMSDGRLSVGSICLDEVELPAFCEALLEASKSVEPSKPATNDNPPVQAGH